jgi:diaminopimelate epimerase
MLLKRRIYSGAGNTFVIEILNSQGALPNSEFAQALCTEHKVDGYLGLENKADNLFKWHFFNRDGSQAEFCGNAARCAQAYLNQSENKVEAHHETPAGMIKTWTENASHWVLMPTVKILSEKHTIDLDGQVFVGLWCDTGVPHFVTNQRSYRFDFWKQISQKLRSHPSLEERGANITWVGSAQQGRPLQALTYERGVEDFTQACGTGALAAALYLQNKWPDEMIFRINMPGGPLEVKNQDTSWIMTGAVEKIADL